ncbi:MAG: LGFP repeat-containing protein [Mycobacterium leprae]
MKTLRALLAVLLLLTAVAVAPTPTYAAGPQGIQFGRPIDDSGNILLTDAVAASLAASGAGWVRLNFRLGPWTSDTAQFYSTYDTIVNNLRNHGLQVVGLMSNEFYPGTQSDWTANNYENTGGNGHNAYIDSFGYQAARVANHYQSNVKYWEVWNEPNCYATQTGPTTFTGCSYMYPSNFADLLGHVYTQLKYYNHYDVQVISGGLLGHSIGDVYSSGNAGATYLTNTYSMGINHGSWNWIKANAGSYPLDGIGQHIYITQGGTVSSTNLQNYLTWVRNAYTAYEGTGTAKKTWVTEIGWPTDSVSESVQAANIDTTYQVMKSTSYIASCLWFYLRDEASWSQKWGIQHADGTGKTGWTNFQNDTSYEGRNSDGSINQNILNKYNAMGGIGTNGSPYDNGGTAYVHYWDYGYVQDFNGGSIGRMAIMTSSSGTFRVDQGFWTTYLSGSNHTYLKFPTSDAYAYNGGTRQDFQGGYLTWDSTNGIVVH